MSYVPLLANIFTSTQGRSDKRSVVSRQILVHINGVEQSDGTDTFGNLDRRVRHRLHHVPITKAQKSFLLCRMPEVGKSKILGVIQEVLLGAENVSNIPLQNLTDRFQPAEIFGKLANIYADLPDKKIDDVGMFKAATGADCAKR